MIQEVLLYHSPADLAAVDTVVSRLERWGEIRVLPEPCESIPEAWDPSLRADAAILLLSPDSAPGALDRWRPLLEHIDGNAAPPAAAVLARQCRYPKLLERKLFFRLEEPRDIERWVMSLHDPAPTPVPPVPGFSGRRSELDRLWTTLVDSAGTVALVNPEAGSGKTWLARQFAAEAGEHFREIIWIDRADRAQKLVVGELAWRLGVPGSGTYEDVAARIQSRLDTRRILVVLDGAAAAPILPRGAASLLITTKHEEWPEEVRILPIDNPGFPVQPVPDGQGRRAHQLNSIPARADLLPEIETAVEWALEADWSLAQSLTRRACVFLKSENRFMEAAYLYEKLGETARDRGDAEVAAYCLEELSWLLDGERLQPQEISGDQLTFW
jgi:hypothetical protein